MSFFVLHPYADVLYVKYLVLSWTPAHLSCNDAL